MINGIARWCVRHPWLMRGLLLLLLLGGLGGIFLRPSFDTEILNLLPGSAPAVRGLKTYYEDFEQARELALIVRAPDNPGLVAEFSEFLGERLNGEPWVVRWLDGSPMESARGRETLPAFVTPLILQLPLESTRELIRSLESETLAARLGDLGGRLRAGSPAALLQWNFDPLGFYAPAVAPVLDTAAVEKTFTLTAPAGDLRVFSILTNQADLSKDACVALMQTVRAFLEEVRREFGSEAPEVLVTGRSAYVEEISEAMRRDIFIMSGVSFAGICLLFWLVYRRVGILFGLASILIVCSVLALATGLWIFPALNLIAVAFCSILFGLGQDFGLLLLQEVREETRLLPPNAPIPSGEQEKILARALRHRWPGIACVALTTALGFLALLAGESPGFGQMGVLTALGVGLAALLIPVFFFAFLPRRTVPLERGGLSAPGGTGLGGLDLLGRLLGVGRRYAVGAALILAAATVLVASPWHPLRFDVSPASIEPGDLPAARALQALLEAFPDSAEPSLLLLPLPTEHPDQAARRIEELLRQWQESGRIMGFSIGSRLLISPDRWRENLALWSEVDWSGVRMTLERAGVSAGLRMDASTAPFQQIAVLENFLATAPPEPDLQLWRDLLPKDSPWWFLLDRLISFSGDSPGILVAYFQPAATANPAEWQEELDAEFPGAVLTGWSVTVQSLVQWAGRELWIFGVGVSSVIALVLLGVYRDLRLWGIHLLGLATAVVLFLAALKLVGRPINLLGVLGFPLLLGVGVDYATHLLLAVRENSAGSLQDAVARVATPVFLAGLTTMIGFGALILASNPSLRGLGVLCAVGVAACLISAFGVVLPLAARWHDRFCSGDQTTKPKGG